MRSLAFSLSVAFAATAFPLPLLPGQTAFASVPKSPLYSIVARPKPTVAPDPSAECDEAAEMKDGKAVIPAGATEVGKPYVVDEDRGLLVAKYRGRNTTTDAMYPLPCEPSIGGTMPPEELPSQDELDADASLSKFEAADGTDIAKHVQANPLPALSMFRGRKTAGCSINQSPVACDSTLFLRSGQPFEGRDIIYVHGLATKHLADRILNNSGARRTWPKDAAEFVEQAGYFRKYAEKAWHAHIRENLFDPDDPTNPNAGWQWTYADSAPRYNPKSNRYLLIAWSSNQTIEYAQDAMMTQIDLAMRTNKNVVTPPSYPSSHVRPFCSNGCIIISQSTGSLVTSTTMARAASGFFGQGGVQIAGRMRTHVSFEGAISGSRVATVGIGLALKPSLLPKTLCLLFDDLLALTDTCLADTSFVAKSILRDLMPVVAQTVWGPVLNTSPVPTLTIAGGHPTGDFYSLTKILLPGLDDGIVSMNSACGNPAPVMPVLLAPSGAVVTSGIKAFDMSENSAMVTRAVKNYASYRNIGSAMTPGGPFYLAGACTPYLSPTGMVMPVALALSGTPWDTRKRYKNHYSFIQGTIDHQYDGGGNGANVWPSSAGDPASTLRHYLPFAVDNTEETSAVTDSGIYQQFPDGTYLVHPNFAQVREIVRGRHIDYKLFGKNHRIWVWKRTYHLLDKWQQKQSSHYAYEFVGRR